MSKKGDVLTTSLLLSFFIRLCFSCKDLHCFGDYIDTFTCRYDADREENRDISYILSAAWTSEDEDLNISCLLTQSYNKHEQTCNVDMAYYGAEVTFNISITQTISGKHNFTQMCGPFNLSDNFVPVAPFNLTVTFYENYNISWRTAYESELHFLKNGELQYQLSYKTEKESWKTQKYVHILEDEKNVQILKSSFQEDTNYVARIRSKPKSMSHSLYRGEWSEWSDFVTWRTHLHGDPSWTMKFWIPILCGTTFIAMILMFKHLQLPQRLWKNEWVFIPSPAPFFKPLYTGHDGDFKSWLRCPLNMTTLQFDGGVILPEVLEISSRSFLKPGVDDIERHEKILSCKACRVNECAKCRCNTLSRDRLTDHIFVDTVTNEEAHDSLQCIASTGPSVNSDDEEGHENNCYPSLSLDSDQEHLLNHLLPDNSNSVALLNYKMERGLDQSTLRSNMNIVCAIFLPLEEWELPASHSPDDVNVFYNNDNYESYSPISENSIDFGYPRLCLDLDTIDSGFADSECGSPVESDVSPKLSSSESFIEQEDVCQRNYVKQWVPCNSSSINDSAIN